MTNAVLKNILGRRSVRKFTDEQVPRSMLEEIVRAGIWAPIAMHGETHRFTVLTDKKLMSALAATVRDALSLAEGYDFYSPAAFVIVSEESGNPNAIANCACAMQNMMLASYSFGLGSVWVNQIKNCFDKPEVRAMLTKLGVPENHGVYGCLSIGWAAERPAEGERDEAVVRWN